MKLLKVKNYEEMSRKASSIIIEKIKELQRPVIGMATGSTPEGLYQCLIEAYQKGEVSFKDVSTFNLDEYVGMNLENLNSYQYYMNDKLFRYIDISPENTHLPNGNAGDLQKECKEYEKQIGATGRIDIQILGIGLNGHIGFNEPGTSFSSRTHIVDLDESTRHANARFFSSIDEVPTQAITMGIGTIMESKLALLLVSGEKKAPALARLLTGHISVDFPASILQAHSELVIIADEAACRLIDTSLQRIV